MKFRKRLCLSIKLVPKYLVRVNLQMLTYSDWRLGKFGLMRKAYDIDKYWFIFNKYFVISRAGLWKNNVQFIKKPRDRGPSTYWICGRRCNTNFQNLPITLRDCIAVHFMGQTISGRVRIRQVNKIIIFTPNVVYMEILQITSFEMNG